MVRKATVNRKTNETNITISLNIDGKGESDISTGNPFFDHMLTLFSKHGLFDLELAAKGDLEIDFHHTNEDIGITLGQAFRKALKSKKGISRFGTAFTVLDEAQSKVVLDVNDRSYLAMKPKAIRKRGGNYSYSYFKQFLQAFVNEFSITVHVEVLRGEDFHHILESCFKSLALALDKATCIDPRKKGLPTTKGKL